MKAILLLLLVALAGNALRSAAAGKLGDACASDQDCGPAMHCDACRGGGVCARTRPIDPKSKGMGLPFNRYSWLTTHNSFALQGASSATGSMLITATNQQDNVTSQLKNGVRGLMLDLYDFENDIWLCHSFGGQCYNFTAFQPAINVLKEIQTFLERNPSEVITIFIEDYVTSPQGLTKVFNASGLMKYWFPVSKMPKDGGDWPLLSDMIKQNQRLLVFTSKKTKEASDGIAYEWNYIVESQYGDDGMKAGLCPNRAESAPMNTTSKSLVLMNYFPTNPNTTAACADNSKSLISMLNTCHDYSAKRWPNFIAVDFYMKSNGGGAPKATDIVNGHLVCGCDNIAYCKVNATFGTCVVPPKAPKASPKASPSANPPAGDEKSSAVSIIRRSHLWMRLAEMLSIAMFMSL